MKKRKKERTRKQKERESKRKRKRKRKRERETAIIEQKVFSRLLYTQTFENNKKQGNCYEKKSLPTFHLKHSHSF